MQGVVVLDLAHHICKTSLSKELMKLDFACILLNLSSGQPWVVGEADRSSKELIKNLD